MGQFKEFQSAPLTDVREIHLSRCDLHSRSVSIRSPHGCKGRFLGIKNTPDSSRQFQSAPLTDVRGDRTMRW